MVHLMKAPRKQGAIFSGQTTFQEAFPEVKTVDVIVKESGPGNQGLGERRYNRLTFREYLSCSNVACTGRAVSLGEILRDLITRRLTGIHLHRACEGHLEKGGACPNGFDIQMAVTFNADFGPGDATRSCC